MTLSWEKYSELSPELKEEYNYRFRRAEPFWIPWGIISFFVLVVMFFTVLAFLRPESASTYVGIIGEVTTLFVVFLVTVLCLNIGFGVSYAKDFKDFKKRAGGTK